MPKPSSKPTQNHTFRSLSPEQLNAIQLLITGATDQETADAVGSTRGTVQRWRTGQPLFMATLEQERARLWGQTGENLRGLMAKAVQNIEQAIHEGNLTASWELLKCVGMHGGVVNVLGERDPAKVLRSLAEAHVEAEGIPQHAYGDTLMASLTHNAQFYHRREEIEAALWAEFGESPPEG